LEGAEKMKCKDCGTEMCVEVESEFYDERPHRKEELEELHIKFQCPKCFGTYRVIWERDA